MAYTPYNFDRREYLKHREIFKAVELNDADCELCEFNDDAEDLAFELAYTRYRVAELEEFIRNGIENGYIQVPEPPDPALETIEGLQERGLMNTAKAEVQVCRRQGGFEHLETATRNVEQWPKWKKEFAGILDKEEK